MSAQTLGDVKETHTPPPFDITFALQSRVSMGHQDKLDLLRIYLMEDVSVLCESEVVVNRRVIEDYPSS